MEENQIPHKKKYIALSHHHDSKMCCDHVIQWNLSIKDTPNKGHLSIKDKFCGLKRTMAIQFYLLTRTTSLLE